MLTSILNYLIEGIGTAAVTVCGILFDRIGAGLCEIEALVPGLGSVGGVLTAAGAAVVTGLLYTGLAASAAAPLTGEVTEHPLRIVLRCVLAGIGVAASVPLGRYLLSLTDLLFSRILGGGVLPSASGFSLTAPEMLGAVFTDLIPLVSGASLLLHLVLVILMAWDIIKISLMTFEHYLLLTVSLHLSPLLVSFSASLSTRDIAVTFLRSVLGQCAELICTAWGFRVFVLTLSATWKLGTGGITLLQLLVLLLFGNILASLDSLLAAFGFRSLPNADSIRGGAAKLSRSLENAVTMEAIRGGIGAVRSAVSSAPLRPDTLGRFTPMGRAAESSYAAAHPVLQQVLRFASHTAGAPSSPSAAASPEPVVLQDPPSPIPGADAGLVTYSSSGKGEGKTGEGIVAPGPDAAREAVRCLNRSGSTVYTATGESFPLAGSESRLYPITRTESETRNEEKHDKTE